MRGELRGGLSGEKSLHAAIERQPVRLRARVSASMCNRGQTETTHSLRALSRRAIAGSQRQE